MDRLADSYGRPLPADDPLAPLARDIARALTKAGFTLHYCVEHHPPYRLGGVCLLPVASGHDPEGRGGVVVSWTAHDLLALDWDRGNDYHAAHARGQSQGRAEGPYAGPGLQQRGLAGQVRWRAGDHGGASLIRPEMPRARPGGVIAVVIHGG